MLASKNKYYKGPKTNTEIVRKIIEDNGFRKLSHYKFQKFLENLFGNFGFGKAMLLGYSFRFFKFGLFIPNSELTKERRDLKKRINDANVIRQKRWRLRHPETAKKKIKLMLYNIYLKKLEKEKLKNR